MADCQVTCVDHNGTHETISHLGGAGWRWEKAAVVQSIKQGTNTFFTSVNGKRANLAVRTTATGSEYVQTHADGYWTNNLLALGACLITR